MIVQTVTMGLGGVMITEIFVLFDYPKVTSYVLLEDEGIERSSETSRRLHQRVMHEGHSQHCFHHFQLNTSNTTRLV
jgi:hypothetical protein